MPISYDGKLYEDEFALETGQAIEASRKPQESVKQEGGTQVPPEENNAPAASVEPSRPLSETEVRPKPDYFDPPARETPFPRPRMTGIISGLIDSAKKAMNLTQAPAWAMDPVTGEYHTSPQAIESAAELAQLAVLGPAPVANKLAEGTLGSFAGVRSKTLDKSALEVAQAAERQGLSANEIYDKTGFFKGADKRWRQEIDDSGSVHKPSELFDKKLSQVLEHEELYKAYPHLKDVTVRVDQNLRNEAFWDGQNIVLGIEANKDKGILMHEIQHAIQDYESFAKGGSPGRPPQYVLKYESEVNKLRPKYQELLRKESSGEFLSAPMQAELDRLKTIFKTYSNYSAEGLRQARENYYALAGEVEARNVQTRLDLQPLDRARLRPSSTEDTVPSKQIVRDTPVYTDPYMKP